MAYYNGTVGGFLSGAAPTYPNTTNGSSAGIVTPGVYGNATNVAQVTVGAGGDITAIANVAISGVPGTISTQEEGVALSSTVNTLNFVGAGVTASGAGATTTVTIPTYTPTAGTSPATSYSAINAWQMLATPSIFTFDGGGATLINTNTCQVSLQLNSYGSGAMGSTTRSGAAAMTIYFNVVWTVASAPTMTVDIDLIALWAALSCPITFAGGGTVFPTGLFFGAQSNIGVNTPLTVSQPSTNVLRIVWASGAATLSTECQLSNYILNMGGSF